MKNKTIVKNSLIVLFALVLLALYVYSKLESRLQEVSSRPAVTSQVTEISTSTENALSAPTELPATQTKDSGLPSGTTGIPAPKAN